MIKVIVVSQDGFKINLTIPTKSKNSIIINGITAPSATKDMALEHHTRTPLVDVLIISNLNDHIH